MYEIQNRLGCVSIDWKRAITHTICSFCAPFFSFFIERSLFFLSFSLFMLCNLSQIVSFHIHFRLCNRAKKQTIKKKTLARVSSWPLLSLSMSDFCHVSKCKMNIRVFLLLFLCRLWVCVSFIFTDIGWCCYYCALCVR